MWKRRTAQIGRQAPSLSLVVNVNRDCSFSQPVQRQYSLAMHFNTLGNIMATSMSFRYRVAVSLSTFAFALAIVSSSGCGSPDEALLPVFPVSGKVEVDGEPAEGALVVFHPVTELPGELRPSGETGADGTFALSTYDSGDGAPTGEYRVTIVIPVTPAGPNPDPDLAPDRLRGRYANPATSNLQVVVEERENKLPVFAVK